MGRIVTLVLVLVVMGVSVPAMPAVAFQCNDCHGQKGTADLRPVDESYRNITTGGFQGNHRSHMTAAATAASCAVCHPGSRDYTNGHRNDVISLSSSINGSRNTTTYNNRTSAHPQTSTPQLASCSNVNCHFEKDTPRWGSQMLAQPQDCNVCHGAPPADGGHPAGAGSGKKHGDYLGTDTDSCRHCHTDHLAGAAPFAHATSAGKRGLIVQFATSPNSGGSYSGDVSYPTYLDNGSRTGTCNGIYCHSNGAPYDKSNEYRSPTWGGTLTCSGCHDSAGAQTGLSGRHGKHTAPTGYGFTCERCHRDTVTGSDTIIDTTLHVNASKNVALNSGGNYDSETRGCSNTYCHSNALGGAPTTGVKWSDTQELKCYSCHKGTTADNNATDCVQPVGVWDPSSQLCTPYINITTNGHSTLVGPQWVRKYPCYYCHDATVDGDGAIKDKSRHVNQQKDVQVASQWAIIGRPAPTYNKETKECDNVYCHSDGTGSPEVIRPLGWTGKDKSKCNSCHGHPQGTCSSSGCHDGRTDANGKTWTVRTGWAPGEEWKEAMPIYLNQGPGTSRANSHARHMQTNFTCDNCHDDTIRNGVCTDCHNGAAPSGTMRETAHINAQRHVNKSRDVVFKNNSGAFVVNPQNNNKSCSNTKCHRGGADPVWGESVNTTILCINCHGTTGQDVDDFSPFNGKQAKINLTEFNSSGHGRSASLGAYAWSGNPAANFPGNPCWYCHDNNVLHKDSENPFRLRRHAQYQKQFDHECVYCHMEGKESECLDCHNSTASLAPQLSTITGRQDPYRPSHQGMTGGCLGTGCHETDDKRHKTGAGLWTAEQKEDVKNAYVMMGVCLKCHDDDSDGKCTSCHNNSQYTPGFDPGTGLVKAKSRATSMHFGYKHYRGFLASGGWSKGADGKTIGTWKGGKFCWDCHDPHGDSNIYMIQSKVATATDGKFGIPKTGARADVVFTQKVSGSDYAKVQDPQNPVPINGICNVCHDKLNKQHYHKDGGDSHNSGRICTGCHEHRFTDSHASRQKCDTCHRNKAVPRHNGFSLPRDCTKCHNGAVGGRIDVMGQMKASSHHVQGVTVTNKHCYACHWEATSQGLIDLDYHAGYNYKLYTSVKKQASDLVIWGPGVRPTAYRTYSTMEGRATAQPFLATNLSFGIISTERKEVNKLTNVCLGCHSDQNNDTQPFGDCKTPRQYAWDRQSIASRYSQTGTTTWGKYAGTPGASQKNQAKAFSAHGNAVNNAGGGWDTTPASESGAETGTGSDGTLTNSRGGAYNVACYDCHSSHGSKLVGVTSSYAGFNGLKNGGNLKETVAGKGGYMNNYKAADNTTGINPYSAGAGQCFDCHESATPGTQTRNGKTPWGYSTTFGATSPIIGYKDTPRFGQGVKASTARFAYRNSRQTIIGGHMKASEPNGSLPHLAKETGTAAGGTTSTIEDAKGWAVDKWRNFYALITSGTNSGQARRITGNSAGTLTMEPFGNTINAGDTYQIVPYAASVDGLCTPCHDPHGVSPILGANQGYAVPMLKGTWLTSPYKEDFTAPAPYGNNVTNDSSGNPRSWGRYQGNPYPTQPYANYNIDRNTFGGANNRMKENDEQFAGLCVTCHKKEVLTDGINKNQSWKSTDRIHESVKGWGANTEHSYSCSKCHQPHNSGLPRLMRINCLDFNHRGKKASGGVPWAADKQDGNAHWQGGGGGQHRGYPVGNVYNGAGGDGEALTACHLRRNELPANPWPNQNLWNNVTPW